MAAYPGKSSRSMRSNLGLRYMHLRHQRAMKSTMSTAPQLSRSSSNQHRSDMMLSGGTVRALSIGHATAGTIAGRLAGNRYVQWQHAILTPCCGGHAHSWSCKVFSNSSTVLICRVPRLPTLAASGDVQSLFGTGVYA